MDRKVLAGKTDEPPQPPVSNTRLKLFEEPATGIVENPGLWPTVTPEKWNDWRWQMSNRLRTAGALNTLLKLDPFEACRYGKVMEKFRFSATPYYLSLIDWSDAGDPVRRQCIPDPLELEYRVVGDEDPLEEEEDTQVPGLVHRYPDRVLAVVTNTCAMYCRHCTRKRIWHEGESVRSKKELLAIKTYVKNTPEVREVVVSGGDPLTMNLELLDWFLGELRTIPHLEVLRVGTRVPVVLPMRVTDELADMLSSHRPLWLNTQFNHPREVTREAARACDRLLRAGIPVSNQSVLLKGINDTPEVMRDLCHSLQRIMVRPYYLFQCDPVAGVEHFRTSVWTGINIIESIRGHTSGLSVPTFVVDAPGGGGKIPLQPFYMLSAKDGEVMLRNYEGMIIKYFNPQETTGRPGTNGRHRSAAQIPAGSARYARRRLKSPRAGGGQA